MHQGGVRLCRAMLMSVATAGFLIWGFSFVRAIAPSDLLISKIQITGGTGKTANDFVSIYNKSTSTIDLNGFRLVKRTKIGTTDTTLKSWTSPTLINPGSYYTWANSTDGFADLIHADTSSTQTIADDNGVAIRNTDGTIIDSVGWGQAANIFVETSPYPTNPAANEILTRINNQDTNNNSLDFNIPSNTPPPPPPPPPPTQTCGNSIIETPETCDDGNILDNDGCSSTCQIEIYLSKPSDVVINEFVSDPPTGSEEWVELYLTIDKNIDVTNWTIEDNSGTKTTLAGILSKDNRFLVIDKPKGALNNAGDAIILKTPDGIVIDRVSYGDFDDGNLADNAPETTDPFSIARTVDGLDTNNDLSDFSITESVTKGSPNVITAPVTESDEENSTTSPYDYSRMITISEIFPNPVGIDNESTTQEFIELYNTGDHLIKLEGWRIEVGEIFYLFPKSSVISNGQYLTISAKFPLPNDGASVKLYQPEKLTSFQTVAYKKAEPGQSYARFEETGWRWTLKSTPNEANILAQAPIARFDIINDLISGEEIQFDSSDSFLGEQNANYFWDFGDGTTSTLPYPIHIFKEATKESIKLTVTTQFGQVTETKNIKINKPVVEELSDVKVAAESKTKAVKSVKVAVAKTKKPTKKAVSAKKVAKATKKTTITSSDKKTPSQITIGPRENSRKNVLFNYLIVGAILAIGGVGYVIYKNKKPRE